MRKRKNKIFCLMAFASLLSFNVVAKEQCEHSIYNKIQDCNQYEFINDILVAKFNKIEGKKPIARVLFIGGVHGNERSSYSLSRQFLNKLKEKHSGYFEWVFIPFLNVEGYDNNTRINGNQVDIDRNFPTKNWPQEASKYWHSKKFDRTRFPGARANSEKETQLVVKLIEDFNPHVIVQVHAPFGMVDYDEEYHIAPKNKSAHVVRSSTKYAGSLTNYVVNVKNKSVLTIELPSANVLPHAKESDRLWNRMVKWIRDNRYKQGRSEVLY